ncbi:MAG: DegT/DnrJ/EryC1/StrS family aminotransferase [Patescibacteria group bacterium]
MRIPVNEPIISPLAKNYVLDCLDTGWVSSAGTYITRFEKDFADYIGVKYATAVSNGTTALHLALDAIGLKPGDEVIIPNLTIISCALAPIYLQAKPVLVDVQRETGNLDPKQLESQITKKTKAIMIVHLYGHPVDFDEIKLIAQKYNVPIIEDAAEAHGARYKNQAAGSLGDIACFSFYANKIITTGEGGMVVTNNKKYHEIIELKKNLAHSPKKRFFHEIIGYNYRLTNMQAALGAAHLQEIEAYIQKKRRMVELYNHHLADIPELILPAEKADVQSVFWMYNIRLKQKANTSRDKLMEQLAKKGIETRSYFHPMHMQPILRSYVKKNQKFPISEELASSGFYLPSGLTITENQIKYVANELKKILHAE